MTRVFVALTLLCITSFTTADADDLKKLLKELVACKSAAIRLCDRSHGITAAALWNCGATLAAHQQKISQSCIDVLKRYGQL